MFSAFGSPDARYRRLPGRSLTVLALALTLTGAAVAPAGAETATTATRFTATRFNSVAAAPAVLREAAKHAGKTYRYGAVGPAHFDCSGFTMYVFSRFGVSLPHNSGAQRAATVRIPAAARRPGDLVFTHSSSGRVTHVGIYTGNNMMWHSPRTGDVVKHSPLFSRRVSYGRVG